MKDHFVEPWTRWQGNPNSLITLVGDRYGETNRSRAKQWLPALDGLANAHLVYLFHLVGIPLPPPPLYEDQAQVFPYGTNSLLFFTNASLRRPTARSLSQRFAQITSPLIIIAGSKAYKQTAKIINATKSYGQALGRLQSCDQNRCIYTVPHPSARTHLREQVKHWLNLRDLFYSDELKTVHDWLVEETHRHSSQFVFPVSVPRNGRF